MANPRNNLRRAPFGYRRADVVAQLGRLHGQLDEMAASLDRLWRDREDTRRELAETRARHEQELDAERVRGERVEAEARAEAARIVADAEEQAARLRHEAGRRVADAADRLEELLRVREQLLGELRGIVHAYGDVLEAAAQGKLPALAEAEAAAAPAVAEAPGRRAAEVADSAATARLFPRRVELDAGPFSDFAELSVFERALAGLPKVEDVHVRRFGEERAEIELTLAEETPLVHDLDRHLPYRVVVRPDGDDHLTVDVDAATAAAG